MSTEDIQPGRFWGTVFALLILGLVGWVLSAPFSGDSIKNICLRAAADPKHAHRDVLRDCRLDENGKKVPLTREERRALEGVGF